MSARDLLVSVALCALIVGVFLAAADGSLANVVIAIGVVLLIVAFIVEIRNRP